MTKDLPPKNRVRQFRAMLGLTQAELAGLAGVSRSAVTAIEGDRLVPSVEAAIALSKALGTTVEELFGRSPASRQTEVWESKSTEDNSRCWRAEVLGRTILYPADSLPMFSLLPDQRQSQKGFSNSAQPTDTLVMACCDPAAGLLASLFAESTGMRLIVLPRSSTKSVEMLRDRVVHLAGLHLSTDDNPEQNSQFLFKNLGAGFQTIRLARWQEGVVTKSAAMLRSVRAVVKARLNWVGRDSGSGAWQCLDRLFGGRFKPSIVARDHRGVAEAVRSGWAEAGVCVQLVAAEAGLKFLPVQQEAFDVCFPNELADDHRIRAFLSVVRSVAYRRCLSELPGYDSAETGQVSPVSA